MQAASVCLAGALPLKSTKISPPARLVSSPRPPKNSRVSLLLPKATASDAPSTADNNTIDYSSSSSVFPAEACEMVGGEACEVNMYPEARLAESANSAEANVNVEEVEREYLDYNQPKTVFPGEACDDLGGEFCAAEYQEGVMKERALAS